MTKRQRYYSAKGLCPRCKEVNDTQRINCSSCLAILNGRSIRYRTKASRKAGKPDWRWKLNEDGTRRWEAESPIPGKIWKIVRDKLAPWKRMWHDESSEGLKGDGVWRTHMEGKKEIEERHRKLAGKPRRANPDLIRKPFRNGLSLPIVGIREP